jgi:hypothetical protein
LRLISSAAHPGDRPAIRRKFFLSRPLLNSFWGSIGFDTTSRRSGCDHYHAVPLSDGHHILFIDPGSNRLVLGCDAPLGGPTKLLRKVIFVPLEENAVPRLYTAAADLSHGAYVVVSYGETIVLYSIPPDVITFSQMERKAQSSDAYTSKEGLSKNHWLNWWDEPYAPNDMLRHETNECNTIWPIAIHGTNIGKLKDICELAVQTQPDITIWAFTHSSQCKSWRMRNSINPILRTKQHVCRDGIVHDSYLADKIGDVIMTDTPSSSRSCIAIDLYVRGDGDEQPRVERSVMLGFDGNASGVMKRMPRALAVENDDWVDMVDVQGCSDAWYDNDGDVVMFYGT